MGKREFIARNVAAMFHDGDVVNLGVGIPTLASTYVPEGMTVLFHAENGCVGAGEAGGFPWDFSTRESVIAWMDSCAGEKRQLEDRAQGPVQRQRRSHHTYPRCLLL